MISEHFAETEHRAILFAHGREFGGVINYAGRYDGALSRHQPRNGTECTDGAGIRQRNGGALEVRDLQLIRARPRHDVIVRGNELGEVHPISVLDIRHFQGPRAVLGRDVDGEAQIYLAAHDAKRLAAVFGIRMVQPGVGLERLDDCPGDQLCEAQLPPAFQRPVFIDEIAIFFDDANRNLPL